MGSSKRIEGPVGEACVPRISDRGGQHDLDLAAGRMAAWLDRAAAMCHDADSQRGREMKFGSGGSCVRLVP